MKLSRINGLSIKQIAAVLVALFVLSGAIVGYLNEFQMAAPAAVPQGVGYSGALPVSPPSGATFAMTTVASGTEIPHESYVSSFGGRMVELQAYLTVQVDEPKSSSSKIIALASSLGGYVAESSFDDASSSSNLVLRVPQENFTLALKQISTLGKVKAQSISSNDVTEQYVNLQAELDAYKTEEQTLLRILNSSNTVKDALATQDIIRDVQAQINQIEGELHVMERLVAFILNVQLIQPEAGPTLDFGNVVQSAILSFYIVVKGMMILGASLLPIAMVGGVAYIPYRRFSKKKQTTEAKVNVGS